MIEALLLATLSFQVDIHAQTNTNPLKFLITHDGSVGESLDGRVYVMLTKGKVPPIGGPNWWNPEPFFAMDVTDWETGTPLVIDDSADAMGGNLSTLDSGPWRAAVVYRPDTDRSTIAVPGGLYSEVVLIEGLASTAGTQSVHLDKQVPDRNWKEHKNLRLIEKNSPMLSNFFGREVNHGACVIVPDNYDPERPEPYPVMYWIGGFGSDHYGARMMKAYFTASDYDDQICRVILNAQTHSGHHVFADSANNGPRMTALIHEWIPYLEETYNLGGSGERRFLAGHSSGGWSSLWLQIQNPDFFNGVWSLAPDPIDFRFFKTPNLYAENANMFVDEAGNERPIARQGTEPVLWTRGFSAMDDVIKDGGQLGSFEWAFSPRGENGRPLHMYDRQTGSVDAEVVDHWKSYDIRKILEGKWDILSPKLRGKINIIAGGLDTFYLEGSVISLQEYFNVQGFDAMVRILENANHGAVFGTPVIREMDEFIANKLQLPNIQQKTSK